METNIILTIAGLAFSMGLTAWSAMARPIYGYPTGELLQAKWVQTMGILLTLHVIFFYIYHYGDFFIVLYLLIAYPLHHFVLVQIFKSWTGAVYLIGAPAINIYIWLFT